MPTGRGEAGDVGHHATTDADDHVVAGETHARELATQRLDGRERLVVLAITDLESFERNAGVDVDRDAGLSDDGRPTRCGRHERR